MELPKTLRTHGRESCCTETNLEQCQTAIAYTNFDCNGDTLINVTADAWFYKELTGRVNLTEIQVSPFLRNDPLQPDLWDAALSGIPRGHRVELRSGIA